MKIKPETNRRRRCLTGLAVLMTCGASIALADPQSSPQQASTLQSPAQRVERYYEQQQVPKSAPVDPLKQPASSGAKKPAPGHGKQFVLHKVDFTRSTLLPLADLEAVVRPYLGREVDSAALAVMLDKINALYAARKITTARAVFADQTVRDGVVHVELVEGRLGKLKITGVRHVHDHFIRERIHQKVGEVVDANSLRDDLVYMNRTTDLQTKALLEPGTSRGTTDILLDVTEPDRHTLNAYVDNNGVDSTGRFRAGVDGSLYGLFGVDDQLSGYIAHSRGGNDGDLSYSIPLMLNNGRIGVSYSRSQIDIINGAFRNLDIKGSSSVASLQYNQPLIANLNWLFSGLGSYSVGDASTDISGQHIADTRTRAITLGLSLQHQKDGQTWAVSQVVTRLHSDEPMLGKSSFLVAPGSAYFIQRLGQSRWALRSDAGWQFSTGKNIPSANLFQIGGLGSVRGYERGVIAGARGYYLSAELHRTFGERLDAYAFVDHGTIYSFYPTDTSITGAGLGILYRYKTWLTVSADVAKPFNTVTPEQDGYRADMRVSVHWK